MSPKFDLTIQKIIIIIIIFPSIYNDHKHSNHVVEATLNNFPWERRERIVLSPFAIDSTFGTETHHIVEEKQK